MRKVLILVNHDIVIFSLRLELVERLLKEGYSVAIACPRGERVDEFSAIGCEYHEINLTRHGINPLHEVRLLSEYRKLLERVRPDVVFTFSIKPNVYGGLACKKLGIPCFANVTGLGTTLKTKSPVRFVTKPLYRLGLKSANTVFVQNQDNLNYLLEQKMIKDNYHLLPGSGVSLSRFPYEPYPTDEGPAVLLVIGRITRDKGTDDILSAVHLLRAAKQNVRIRFLGFYDGDYRDKVEQALEEGMVEYCGHQNDVQPYLKDCHAVLHASYHEGMANALLEAAASGRPILATRIPGCQEAFEDGVSGFGFEPHSPESLCAAVKNFLALSPEERAEMGKRGREKMEREFDRSIVVDAYLQKLQELEQ